MNPEPREPGDYSPPPFDPGSYTQAPYTQVPYSQVPYGQASYSPVASVPLGGIAPGSTYPVGAVAGGTPTPAGWVVPGGLAGTAEWGGAAMAPPILVVPIRQRIGGALAVIGGCVAVAGTFVRWVTADLEGLGIRNGNGWSNVVGSVSWGPGIAFVSLLVTMLGAVTVGGFGASRTRLVGLGASLLLLAMTAAQLWDVARDHPGATTTMGPGTPLMVSGAALALFGMLLASLQGSPAKV